LKIDLVFTRDITTNPDAAAIALAIINMAHSLNLDVIAEGVETAEQLTYLFEHRCDQIQGFYFSQPLPAGDLAAFLGSHTRLPDAEHLAETVLLVDDDETVVTALHALLTDEGYRVLVARSAAEGFDWLAQHDVQVILGGNPMPTSAGPTFLEQVKDLHPRTTRMVVSAYAELGPILDAVNRGTIHRYFTTPWDDEVLRATVRHAFHEHWHAGRPTERSERRLPETLPS